MVQPDLPASLFTDPAAFLAAHGTMLLVLLTSALGSGLGAWFGAQAVLVPAGRARSREIQACANVAIAALVALLGKLINFKKDLAFPAEAEAKTVRDALMPPAAATGEAGIYKPEAGIYKGEAGISRNDEPMGVSEGEPAAGNAAETTEAPPPVMAPEMAEDRQRLSIRLELWPEFPFELRLAQDKLFEQAGTELDMIQLLKMLDYNLAELTHLVRQRNALIAQMNAHQAIKGALPADGLKLYLRYAGEIARNVDENLFFIDRGIGKVRAAAKSLLPYVLHAGIADVGLQPEAAPLMPARDLIKGWIK